MSLLSRIYIWSIMFEPLMFFVFSSKGIFSFTTLSFSRVLQILVLILLALSFFLKLIKREKIIITNNLLPENQYLLLFYIMSIFSILVGLIYGSYNLPINVDQYFLNKNPYLSRSFFEYFILLYNIIYFVILPKQLIKSKYEIDYLFKIFKFFLLISLFIGYADYILYQTTSIDLLGRNISDGFSVGNRFHGLGGEPRQSAVQMIFYLSFYLLYCSYFNIKIQKWIIFLLILSLPLTSSMSLFVSVIILIFFLIIFRFIKLKLIILIVPVLVFMYFDDRVNSYIYNILNVVDNFQVDEDLPYLIYKQRGSFYPLYDMYNSFRNFELIPILFGNGLGSSGAINNFYYGDYLGISNPNSQGVRLLFEHGVIGSIIFIISLIWPIKYLAKNVDNETKNFCILGMILVLSATLSVRSPIIFIYLGVMTLFLSSKEKKIRNFN